VFLVDHQLRALLQSNPPLVSGFPESWNNLSLNDRKWNEKSSPIQPCSIDLHVGEIYIPGAKRGRPGSTDDGRIEYLLESGHSVIVRSLEELHVPRNIGAIALPPSRLSSRGIFIANFGHVDPGYNGHMRFTIINMGRAPYTLRRGGDVITLLFFSIQACEASWSDRNREMRPIRQEEVNVLAKDFADLNNRMRTIAKTVIGQSGWKFLLGTIVAPAALGLVLAAAGYWFSLYSIFVPKMDALHAAQSRLENNEALFKSKLADFEIRLKELSTAAAPQRAEPRP